MISENLLGRYEHIDQAVNSRKFWWLVYNKDTREYTAYWGRIGNKASTTVYVGDDKALVKVKEKLKKGYELRDGYTTTVGCNASHFILSILDDEAA